MRAQPEVPGNDVTGTRSHVFWDGKPLSSLKKGSWAQGGAKPLRKAGSKSKVQLVHRGWSLDSKKKKDAMLKNKKMIYSKGSVTGDRVGAWIQDEGEHKSSWGRPSFLSF